MDFQNDCCMLEQVFRFLIAGKKMSFTVEVLQKLMQDDLKLKTEELAKNEQSTLPQMLLYYMTNWPGWNRNNEYCQGQLNLLDWYNKFRKYLIFKMTVLISDMIPDMVEELQIENSQTIPNAKVDNCTQTPWKNEFTELNLQVLGPPTILNSIMFSSIKKTDDVIISEHVLFPLRQLQFKELLNWPFVEVSFFSPELSFTRSFKPEFCRNLSLQGGKSVERAEFISSIEVINHAKQRAAFTYHLLYEYVRHYHVVCKCIMKEEPHFFEILRQFLRDIEEINIDRQKSMATNTSVTFNMGKCIFERTKILEKTTHEDDPLVIKNDTLIYSEIIVPRTVLSLIDFSATQDVQQSYELYPVTFDKLNRVDLITPSKNPGNFLPVVLYKCLYCNLSFGNSGAQERMMAHLRKEHKKDPPVVCMSCKKDCEVLDLAAVRWRCPCQK